MGETTMWERLDKALTNDDWISMFPATKVMHLECGTSDYKPLIILPLVSLLSDRNLGDLNKFGWKRKVVMPWSD